MKPKSNYINQDQFHAMLAYIPELQIRKWSVSDVQMSMKLAYNCALRYGSEVAQRTKEDFDFERHEVYLGKTKTRTEDYAPIPLFFEPELMDYWQKKLPLEPILKDCSDQNMYKWLLKIGEALEIEALLTPQSVTHEKTKLHIFRKSMLKDMYFGTFGKRANLGQVQSHARHKKLTTTAAYLKLDIEGSKEFFEELEN